MQKLISFTIKSEKGFFKKPDINDGIYLTYNMIHKPVVLGILGAIIGLEGYMENQKLPMYYTELNSIPIGIKPENDEKGNYSKTIITYNNTIGFASQEPGGNLMISEQTLIEPSFTIFLLLDLENVHQQNLYNNIKNQQAVYLPYMGKNDYSAWWNKEEVKEYEVEEFDYSKNFSIRNLFLKENPLIKEVVNQKFSFSFAPTAKQGSFMYFERLPVGFNEQLFQYNYGDFAFTDYLITKDSKLHNLYKISDNEVVQLN